MTVDQILAKLFFESGATKLSGIFYGIWIDFNAFYQHPFLFQILQVVFVPETYLEQFPPFYNISELPMP